MSDDLVEKAMRHGRPPQGLAQVYALSLWKCLEAPYLARSFSAADRVAAFLHTYGELSARLPIGTVRALAGDDQLLWQEGDHLITAKLEHVISDEGEVTLHHRRGTTPLGGPTFSLVPGRLVMMAAPTVLLVARLQGPRGADASGTESSTQHGLYAAMLGIARAAGLPLVGIAATNQICFREDRAAAFTRAYDELYRSMGGRPLGPDFFLLPPEPPRRALAEIAPAHRRRARQRRAARDRITDAAAAAWVALARGTRLPLPDPGQEAAAMRPAA